MKQTVAVVPAQFATARAFPDALFFDLISLHAIQFARRRCSASSVERA
jgi:hypothetical protein